MKRTQLFCLFFAIVVIISTPIFTYSRSDINRKRKTLSIYICEPLPYKFQKYIFFDHINNEYFSYSPLIGFDDISYTVGQWTLKGDTVIVTPNNAFILDPQIELLDTFPPINFFTGDTLNCIEKYLIKGKNIYSVTDRNQFNEYITPSYMRYQLIYGPKVQDDIWPQSPKSRKK